MPKQDMPLEELYQYQGINPRPDDFDAFWDRALAEQRGTDPQPVCTPADFTCSFADCYDLYFTGVRGARVYAKLLKPKQMAGPAPVLLQFHGYSMNSGDWISLLPYVAQGFVVAAMDCRGQGGRSEDVGGTQGSTLRGHFIRGVDGPADDMLMRHVMLDTVQLARVLLEMPDTDEGRVVTTGRSQGGALSLVCAALEPRVCRVAAGVPFLTDYQRVWEMDAINAAYEEIVFYFRRFDPRHLHEKEFFTKLGYVDVQHLASRVRAKVQMQTGLMDLVCPPSSQFALYNKIVAPKELLLYPDYGHEQPAGAGDLVFAFLQQVQV